MKNIIKYLFFACLIGATSTAIWFYHQSLPTKVLSCKTLSYPQIDQTKLYSLLTPLTTKQLLGMHKAGLEVLKWQKLLNKVDLTVMGDIIKDHEFYVGKRYPEQSIVDYDSKCSYFYHSHRPKEHGHFHIYFSNDEIISTLQPYAKWNKKTNHTHIVALSMHPDGEPIGLFIPNQWVTKDNWYYLKDMIAMLDHYEIGHPYPSWPSNQWLNNMLKLFRPQIEELITSRDQFFLESGNLSRRALKNRKNEIIVTENISIDGQMDMIEKILDERGVAKAK